MDRCLVCPQPDESRRGTSLLHKRSRDSHDDPRHRSSRCAGQGLQSQLPQNPERHRVASTKILHCLARSGNDNAALAEFVDEDVNSVISLFDDFNHGTHGNAGRFDLVQLTAIKMRVEGAIQWTISSPRRATMPAIDEKLDDVRRAQRDEVLAKLDGVAFAIKDAMIIREHVGRVSDVAWSKVQATSAAIGETQSSGLRALDALAGKLEGKTKVGELAKTAKEAKYEVGVWLAVLARCFQLQDEFEVLELDRVMQESPADLDGHRLALSLARLERRERILRTTERLMDRMDAAAGTANSRVLLHSPNSRAVVHSINHVGIDIDDFHRPLGIESSRQALEATRWWDAARERGQWANAAEEAGPKVVAAVVGVAGVILYGIFGRRDGGRGGEG